MFVLCIIQRCFLEFGFSNVPNVHSIGQD
jgi:hypothetical protein